MGYKAVCFTCRKCTSRPHTASGPVFQDCATCGDAVFLLDQKFQPPKKSDSRYWKVVRFLVHNGFRFQHVYKDLSKSLRVDEASSENYVAYPRTMKEAIAFVKSFKKQARQ